MLSSFLDIHFQKLDTKYSKHCLIELLLLQPTYLIRPFSMDTQEAKIGDLGGVPGARPLPKGPDSFVLTYKIFKT